MEKKKKDKQKKIWRKYIYSSYKDKQEIFVYLPGWTQFPNSEPQKRKMTLSKKLSLHEMFGEYLRK